MDSFVIKFDLLYHEIKKTLKTYYKLNKENKKQKHCIFKE